MEPAVRPHQTMAFCCKQSQGSLPEAHSISLSLSLSLSLSIFLPAAHGPLSGLRTIILDKQHEFATQQHRVSFLFVSVHQNLEPGKVKDKAKFSNSTRRMKLKVCLERKQNHLSSCFPHIMHNVLMFAYQ